MALKTLLGLDAFPLSESEIMSKIQQAYKNNSREIEFIDKDKKVRVSLSDCTLGVTSWHESWGG